MAYIPCADCEANHKCGIVCASMKCLDDKCGCTAKEIAEGLYHCDTCKLVFSVGDSFQNYFADVEKWFGHFCEKNNSWYRDVKQRKLTEKPISERDQTAYAIVENFLSAKRSFSMGIPATLRLDTIKVRGYAYELVQAFEELKKLEI